MITTIESMDRKVVSVNPPILTYLRLCRNVGNWTNFYLYRYETERFDSLFRNTCKLLFLIFIVIYKSVCRIPVHVLTKSSFNEYKIVG